jgi:hypothetical protein
VTTQRKGELQILNVKKKGRGATAGQQQIPQTVRKLRGSERLRKDKRKDKTKSKKNKARSKETTKSKGIES